MRRCLFTVTAIALVLAGGKARAAEPPHVSLVPWKVLEPGEPNIESPLVLFWIPASREELRRSELLTSQDLLLFSSQCVAMRVVRTDDYALLDRLDAQGELPMALLADGSLRVLRSVEGEDGALSATAVEEMVREELGERASAAETLLDRARDKADAGEIDDAVAIYTAVWEQRCVCPRQGKDAQRALKKLKR